MSSWPLLWLGCLEKVYPAARSHRRLLPLLLRKLRHPPRHPPRPLHHHPLKVRGPHMPARVPRLERQLGSLDAVVEAHRSPLPPVSFVPWSWGRQLPQPRPAKPIASSQCSHTMGSLIASNNALLCLELCLLGKSIVLPYLWDLLAMLLGLVAALHRRLAVGVFRHSCRPSVRSSVRAGSFRLHRSGERMSANFALRTLYQPLPPCCQVSLTLTETSVCCASRFSR